MLQKGDICYGYTGRGWKTGIYMGEIGSTANSFRVYNVYFVSSRRFEEVYNVTWITNIRSGVETDVTER